MFDDQAVGVRVKTLVTGAAGFVGRAVVPLLREAGREVVVLDSHLIGISPSSGLTLLEGDLCDRSLRQRALNLGIEAVIHLATVPGGAAEADPALARRVNIDATLDLLDDLTQGGLRPRVVFASSIAVYGEEFPPCGVDERTPIAPRMLYGAHKAMIETWIATKSRRGDIEGISLRLPGIVARPRGPSGMKSAFISDLFHVLAAGERFVSPVSPSATMLLMSVSCCARNLSHALTVNTAELPESRIVQLPALLVRLDVLARTVSEATGHGPADLRYEPDADLETAFGRHTPLSATIADRLGFTHDGTIESLVTNALAEFAGVRR